MGAFFTNIQVHARGLDLQTGMKGVIESLRHLVVEKGYVLVDETSGTSEPVDRTILIEAAGEWISVYDEATEAQRQDDLDALATELSKRIQTHAITVMVHDSDVLSLGLFRSGALVDRFNNNPGYFGKVTAAQRKSAAGQPEKWASIIGEADARGLDAIWKQAKLFAEDTLQRTAEVLALEPARVCTGFRYLDHDDPKYTVLKFRHAVRPAYETPAMGSTSFELASYTEEQDFSVGSPIEVWCAMRNVGVSSRGLSVVVWGAALDRALLSVSTVEVAVGRPPEQLRLTAPCEVREGVHGERLRIATFSDLMIPAGAKVDFDALRGGNQRGALDAMFAAQIHAKICGEAVDAGEGELHVGFVPETAPAGQCGHTVRTRVHAASRKPLRCLQPMDTHSLRMLDGRGSLFALASMELDRKEAAAAAAALIARWGTGFDLAGRVSLSIFPADQGARPRTGSAKAKGFFASARFRKLCEELRSERLVCGTFLREKSDLPHQRGDGFSFGGTLYPKADSDAELPTLGLWLDVSMASPDRLLAATSLANELMDEVMARHCGVQALVGRWDWAPSIGQDTTPYELACGVHGQCTLRRSWLSRFVRGVAVGALWLGRSLASRIDDVDALRQAAHVVASSNGLKICIESEAALDAVEAAMARVLPGAEDWQQGVARMYGRA